jgi:hypothetical protein
VSSGLVGKTIPEKRCIGPVIFHNNVLSTYRLEISRAHPQVLGRFKLLLRSLQMGLRTD